MGILRTPPIEMGKFSVGLSYIFFFKLCSKDVLLSLYLCSCLSTLLSQFYFRIFEELLLVMWVVCL